MIQCKALNKEFSTKEELFKELKANESKIIAVKKAQVFKSAEKGQLSISGAYLKDEEVSKADINAEKGFVYPVINTTWYMDGHNDVHKSGLWKKTLKDNVGKIFYVSGHKFDVDNVITWPEDVEVFTKEISWKSVGKDFEGTTEALIFKIKEENIGKESAREAIKGRRKVQGSVSMMYVKIDMAINHEDKDYALNKVTWDANIEMIANKEKAIELGFFFLVSEAKIVREGSMVLAGSNDATEIIYSDEQEDMMDDEEMMDEEDEDKGCKPRKPKKEQPGETTENKDEAVHDDTSEESIYKYLLIHLKK